MQSRSHLHFFVRQFSIPLKLSDSIFLKPAFCLDRQYILFKILNWKSKKRGLQLFFDNFKIKHVLPKQETLPKEEPHPIFWRTQVLFFLRSRQRLLTFQRRHPQTWILGIAHQNRKWSASTLLKETAENSIVQQLKQRTPWKQWHLWLQLRKKSDQLIL